MKPLLRSRWVIPLSLSVTLVIAGTIAQTLGQVTAPPLPPPAPEPGQLIPMEAPPAATGPQKDPMKPTMITLQATDMPVPDALSRLQEQSGYTFRSQIGDRGRTVTLDFQDKPLWEALSMIISNNDGMVMPLSVSDQGVARPAEGTTASSGVRNFQISGRIFAQGPYLLIAGTMVHSVDFEHGEDVESLNVNASLATNFASGYLSYISPLSTPAKAMDDKGNSLVWTRPIIDARPNNPTFGGAGRQTTQQVTIRMECPVATHVGKTVTTMDGVLQATFNGTEVVEVPVGRSFERALNGATITVEVNPDAPGVDPNAPPVARRGTRGGVNPRTPNTVFYRLTRDPTSSPEDWRTWQIAFSSLQISMVDSDGKVWQRGGMGGGSGRDANGMDMFYRTLNFRNAPGLNTAADGRPTPVGKAVKAIVEIPVSSKNVEIPYHFENLPIP